VSCGAPRITNELRRWGGLKLTAVNRRLPDRRNRDVIRRTYLAGLLLPAEVDVLEKGLRSIAPYRNEM
jgi:hypothetical protein